MKIRLVLLVLFTTLAVGCSTVDNTSADEQSAPFQESTSEVNNESMSTNSTAQPEKPVFSIKLTEQIKQLESGLSAVKYEGNYGFEEFLATGGASSDSDVVKFLSKRFLSGRNISFGEMSFGCSTISVKSENGGYLFGRNFDWNACDALIVYSVPQNDYASISTVNTDFINMAGMRLSSLPDNIQAMIAMYAPLDGMNEKGLAVSVNMIQDSATISQNTNKPDITTTTAIRLLLNKAADVDEALELLRQYDMHASMGFMTHLAISDNSGKSVVVEYVNNEMKVVETPVVTNFYLVEGSKHGIGTAQSHERYDILMNALGEKNTMNMNDVRDALSSVSKKNFGEFESTEWSIVFNQSTGEVHYYHRENYDKSYIFSIK